MPQPLDEYRYHVPGIGRTAIARPDHLLPLIAAVVDHRSAVPQHGDTLIDQSFGHIAADGEPLKSAPFAGLQKGVAEQRPSQAV